MKTFVFFTIILLGVNFIYSQDLTKKDLDSLYNKLIYFNSAQFKAKSVQGIEGESKYEKCGFGLVSNLIFNINRFTQQQQSDIKRILQIPVLQDSLITPDGYFRVHYDPDGINKPSFDGLSVNDCLNLISQTLDSVYKFEVEYLGYLSPVIPYNIYITNSTAGSYGYTEPEFNKPTGNGTYDSYIVIHNNYQNFQTEGINGARVTLAHEFFHAIQIGRYYYRYSTDGFFYELSSTAMEDFVYNTINDYYNYLPYYFNNTEAAFGCSSCNGGEQEYALAIWNIFLRDRFGVDNIKTGYNLLKRQWELMPQMRALQAVNNSIVEYNSTYRKEFNEFGIWLFYTNYRAINGQYFREAANYPLLNIYNEFQNIPDNTINGSAFPTSENYLRFIQKTANNSYDTLDVIISNSDYRNGIDSLSGQFSYQLSVSYNPASVSNNFDINLSSGNNSVWSSTVILNNSIIIRDTTNPQPPFVSLDYAYPNPFFYSINNHIEIPTGVNEYQIVDLNIYTVSMKLVYSKSDYASVGKKGSYILRWNGLDSNGEKLPSGVYIYYTKKGSSTTSGKLVIFDK